MNHEVKRDQDKADPYNCVLLLSHADLGGLLVKADTSRC